MKIVLSGLYFVKVVAPVGNDGGIGTEGQQTNNDANRVAAQGVGDADDDLNRVPAEPTIYTEAKLRNIDPRLQQFTAADERLLSVYGDTCHQNDGSHQHGVIDASEDLAWQQRHKIVIADRHRLYWLPSGRWSNLFLEIYTTLLADVREGRCNSEKMLIFPPCILRRNATA